MHGRDAEPQRKEAFMKVTENEQQVRALKAKIELLKR